jgi:chemotaxis protein methyltransferase CheR
VAEKTFDELRRLIHKRTGLRERNCTPERLANLIGMRLHALNLRSIEEYGRFIEMHGRDGEAELRELMVGLTTGETHFFRDRGQFELLEQTILPALISERRPWKTLRIWSAGCSTGDEAYSIAIALDSLLMNRSDWKIELYGTDVNTKALDKARTGTYTDWSFRVINERRKTTYFQQSSGQWVVLPRIRDAVRFSNLDLVYGRYPSIESGIHDMDLILCRNVFIYFETDSIREVLGKMVQSLRPGGYLLTAHGELHGQEPAQMETLSYPQSSVYRKRSGDGGSRTQRLTEPDVFAVPEPEQPVHPEQFEQLARECANKGDYRAAEDWCRRALAANPFAVNIYYFLAKIAEEQNQTERAKEMLKKSLYLDSDYVAAYVDLSALYDREGDSRRAHRFRHAAIECLRHLEPDAPIEHYEDTTAAELRSLLESAVKGRTE